MRVAEREDPEKVREVAARVRLTRRALNMTAAKLGERLGVGETAINNYEKGRRVIRPLIVSEWRRLDGVTHEWIYDGDMSRLPYELAVKITGSSAKTG